MTEGAQEIEVCCKVAIVSGDNRQAVLISCKQKDGRILLSELKIAIRLLEKWAIENQLEHQDWQVQPLEYHHYLTMQDEA